MPHNKHICPDCGVEIPAGAPAGQCPKCMMKAGFESENGSVPRFKATVQSPGSSGFEPPPVDLLDKLFPQLEVLELLGRGGMGAVYTARQPELDRLVAVKILPPEVRKDPSFAERFAREARALARLSHPNIVAVHDFGCTGQIFYLVMEYVDGANLRQTIQSARSSRRRHWPSFHKSAMPSNTRTTKTSSIATSNRKTSFSIRKAD